MNFIENKLNELDKTSRFELNTLDYYRGQDFEEFIETLRTGINHEEVIYYHVAIDYLKEHDSSLNESIELAEELGFSLEKLNSEVLATLLYQQNLGEQLADIESDIEDIFTQAEELEE